MPPSGQFQSPTRPTSGAGGKTIKRRQAARRKAEQRRRQKQIGVESVTFDVSAETMAKLRASVPFHTAKTLKAVLASAVEAYANQTAKGTQDLASLATRYWPAIRPLLPYFPKLSHPSAPAIRIYDRQVSYSDVAPLLPIYQDLSLRVRNLGQTDIVAYLDLLVGFRK